MISSILCPVDGSEHSDKAITLACDLADRYGAKLHFLHVFMRDLSLDELVQFESNSHLKDLVTQEADRLTDFIQVTSGTGMHGTPYVPPPDAKVVTRIGEVILEDAKQAAEQQGIEHCTTSLVSGGAVDQILSYAESTKADFIIMGHRGLGTISTLLAGSVSNKVSHLAPCTCISVK